MFDQLAETLHEVVHTKTEYEREPGVDAPASAGPLNCTVTCPSAGPRVAVTPYGEVGECWTYDQAP